MYYEVLREEDGSFLQIQILETKITTMCERNEGAILVICNIIIRQKICSVEKQQQREEKSPNQKVMGSEQATESYLTTASNGMFENNIVAVTW